MNGLFGIVAGVCFFLYGMLLTREGLQQRAGNRLKIYVGRAIGTVAGAILLGILVTLVLQSSSASTAMLVGFANAGLVGVSDGLAVALGAGIGTALFVLLLAKALVLPIKGYAVLVLLIGLILASINRKKSSGTAKIFVGFGLVLYGIKLIAEMGVAIKSNPMVAEQLISLASSPFSTILVSALLTAMLQSSTATIGIALSLAVSGALSLDAAVPIVLGANIGTTSTALLASIQTSEIGRRIALGQLLIKLVGVLLFLPFITPFTDFLLISTDGIAMQIAYAHLFFNIALLVFTPVVGLVSQILAKIIPEDRLGEERFAAKYLDKQMLELPQLAFGNAVREIIRMANIVQDMFTKVIEIFKTRQLELIDVLENMDDQVDILNRDIKFYLARISQNVLTEEQAKRQLELLSITAFLEETGDVINRALGKLGRKCVRHQLTFSEEGWKDIKHFHNLILENMHLSITAFATQNEEISLKVLRHKKQISNIFEELQQGHLNRLQEGLKEAFATSAVHMELLTNLLRVNMLITKLNYPILNRADEDD